MDTEFPGRLTLLSSDDVQIPISIKAARLSDVLTEVVQDLPKARNRRILHRVESVDGYLLNQIVDWCEDFCQEDHSDTHRDGWPLKVTTNFAQLCVTNLDLFNMYEAASDLDIDYLRGEVFQYISSMVKDMTPDEKLKYFGVVPGPETSPEQDVRRGMYGMFKTRF